MSLFISRKLPFFVGQNFGPLHRRDIWPGVSCRLEMFITLALVLSDCPPSLRFLDMKLLLWIEDLSLDGSVGFLEVVVVLVPVVIVVAVVHSMVVDLLVVDLHFGGPKVGL